MEEDRNIYVKDGRRYRAIGYWWDNNHDWLSEGVWVVRKRKGVNGITNGDYLKSMFRVDKMSSLAEMSFAELGGLELLTDEVVSRFPSNWYNEPHSTYETIACIVGIIKEIENERNKDKENENN